MSSGLSYFVIYSLITFLICSELFCLAIPVLINCLIRVRSTLLYFIRSHIVTIRYKPCLFIFNYSDKHTSLLHYAVDYHGFTELSGGLFIFTKKEKIMLTTMRPRKRDPLLSGATTISLMTVSILAKSWCYVFRKALSLNLDTILITLSQFMLSSVMLCALKRSVILLSIIMRIDASY